MNITPEFIINILKRRNLKFNQKENCIFLIGGDFEFTEDFIHCEKFIRIFENAQFKFGVQYSREDIIKLKGDWNRFIPLDWCTEKRSHLPKWW